jgi:hypothetical protein
VPVLWLCFFLFFTFWVTSWESACEAQLRSTSVLQQDFQGSPKGSSPQRFFITSRLRMVQVILDPEETATRVLVD